MAEEISLKIFTPEKIALNQKVYRVVLPYGNTNLTIIKDRAPTSLVLHAGALQILAEDDAVKDTYFIDGGVVDVADNLCKISVRNIVNSNKISKEHAIELREKEPQNAQFYQMIVDYKTSFAD